MGFGLLKSLFVWDELETKVLAREGDSPLVRKHSSFRTISLPSGQSINLRILKVPHYKGHKLPDLPVVLFIHGLGGQLNQFEFLFDYFSHFATSVSVDLPGHGKSEYKCDWNMYSQDTLVAILESVLKSVASEFKEVVLVGHSMGTVLAVKLARKLGIRCRGVVAICPVSHVEPGLEKMQPMLGYLPAPIFDIFRAMDRQGGLHSPSVNRMIGEIEDPERDVAVRTKQLRWNLQVRTKAWMRTAYNFRALDPSEWVLNSPLYLLGASKDQVTPESHIDDILSFVKGGREAIEHTVITDAGHGCMIERPQLVCGLVGDFIKDFVDAKLSLSWQLAFFAAKSDKWSLKNEAKWRSVQSVGARLSGAPLRAMKTLRQDDAEHSPALLEKGYPDITDIIDISHEAPPYDPETLTRIVYHKFPTVSKIPPTVEEVKGFIKLVDECLQKSKATHPDPVVVIHCHYGFNRTGFFICCYLIERMGFSIEEAVREFKQAREPGIKHPHFIDELYVRYER